ncbi:hypothetical protein BN946_scf184842.g27 [Trametes cinnabarina]|uniref:HTH CENPB-type domain-containing protein n=1 Tax=Pycnoporus cinnabarinus TaxID=5643 RepID=A0A060S7K9_PYCCI|nr:hypothetical protein BN946_scf184842.g27 [Trametes cinnabarina]
MSNSAPPQSYPQDMSWQVAHHPQPNASASGHAQMPPMMHHSQEHVDYAPPSAQQSFLSRHPQDPFSHHPPPSPSIDSTASSNGMSFDSPQIDGSIGPDRSLSRRRLRPHSRVQSHGELPDYAAMTEAHDHVQNSHYPSHQGSRPQTPNGPGGPDQFMQLSEQSRLPFSTPPAVYSRYAPFPYAQPQSRSTSGSTTSAGSNPRSASPALSVASALTSVSSSASAPNSQINPPFPPADSPLNGRKEANKKRRLYNTDRRAICIFAREHPGVKQEDIAAHFGVERSTVSKILKHKARWLSVAVDEEVLVAKMRPSKFPELEYRLAQWVKTVSKSGTVLSDALLRQRAREIGDSQGYTADKFKASSGWLENFKHRHGIRRGVWVGYGTADAKARAYAEDFEPPVPETDCPPGPFGADPTPPPEDAPGDLELNVERNGHIMHSATPAMHPSALAAQTPWPQPDEGPSTREPTSSSLLYPSGDQSHYSLQQDASQEAEEPVVEAAMPPAEPVPVPLGPESGGSGEQVYVMPVMPEILEQVDIPDAGEAEKAIDKVLTYVRANQADLELNETDLELLMEIKYKLFGKATGQPYQSHYMHT